jgi:hypothetical protein
LTKTNDKRFQLTIPGSNEDDDDDDDAPTTTLSFHDNGHCHQYIQDHQGLLALDRKDCT